MKAVPGPLPPRADLTSVHVRRAIQGERESVEWLVSHFEAFVAAQVRLRLGRSALAEDVEDLGAEVWTVTLRRLPELEPRDGRHAPVLVRFLGTTALQLCNNFLRRRIRRGSTAGAHAASGDGSAAGSRTIDRVSAAGRGALTVAALGEVRRRVEDCLGRLTPEKRDVVVLRIMEQRSNGEIAAMLGIPPNTVAVRYRRALEDLRRCLPEPIFGEIWASRR